MKKNIAVIFGGNSSEYEISVLSGQNIFNNIDTEIFNVFAVHLHQQEWTVTSEPYEGMIVNKDNFSFQKNDVIIKFDCAFIAIHGTPGEDGKIQAYFELLNIPYTSCGFLTSSITFDKFTCNSFLKHFDVLSPKSILLREKDVPNLQQIVDEVGLPCFVKPNNGGSSCGASKVKHLDDLTVAIEKAFKEDRSVIVEQYILGTEITCGVSKLNGKIHIFPLVEIVSKKEFFDYEAKYNPLLAEEILPARIPDNKAEKCKQIATRVFELLHCKGFVRMDFILKGNQFYFLEVNTVPGMTKNSIVPKMVLAEGKTIKEFCTSVIEDALTQK